MNEINKKHNLEIEILTPLSIGAGSEKDWVRGIDFVVDNNKLYKLNIKKIVENGINPEELSSFFSSKNENGLKQKLAGRLNQVSDEVIEISTDCNNDVKAFIKNQLYGNPIIPGSSLKGSIRSILFQYLKDNNTNDLKSVFGTSEKGDDFMRFIKVSDADFDKTNLVNTKIFNLFKERDGNEWFGGWKHGGNQTNETFRPIGFNTLYECLLPEQKSCLSLMLSDYLFKFFAKNERQHIQQDKKKDILQNDIKYLFKIINNHTKKYLEKEKAFFDKYSSDKTDEIINTINELLRQIPDDNSCCILKMSAGSGFHSITGDWQFEDYTSTGIWRGGRNDGKIKYKSRKIAVWNNNYSLMGFVKLRNLSVDEFSEIRENVRNVRQSKQQQFNNAIEEENRRREEEQRRNEEYEHRLNEFNDKISEIKALIKNSDFENALTQYKQNKELYPEFLIEGIDEKELEDKVSLIQNDNDRKRRETEALIAQEKQYNVPLEEKIRNAAKLKTLYNNVKKWMEFNKIENLSDDNQQILFNKINEIVSSMKPREKQRMNNLGKELNEIVGDATAQLWFSKITNQN